MWENIIKRSPHKRAAINIINGYLENIPLYTKEFKVKDIHEWAVEQNNLYKTSNGKEGANYESVDYGASGPDAQPKSLGVPTSIQIAPFLKQQFVDQVSGRKISYVVEPVGKRDNRKETRDIKYRRVK
tara:strand:+ start:1299 stop:1682 length:384 start_codon:yes stop_codon:yes gene_type:complete